MVAETTLTKDGEETNKLYYCLFYPKCKCVFCTPEDLELHMQAFIRHPLPINADAVNVSDHVDLFKEAHGKLERGNMEFE